MPTPLSGFEIVAETGDRFSDFSPYVPAIDGRGNVAFQAKLPSGETGVFIWTEGQVRQEVSVGHGLLAIESHPDMNDDGTLCFYGSTPEGQGLFVRAEGCLRQVSPKGLLVGPLGPTINASGSIAFRAIRAGKPGVYVAAKGECMLVAEVGERFACFHGLPVVRECGDVAFRADLVDGRQGVYLWDGTEVSAVAESGDAWTSLGSFPSANEESLVFAASTSSGSGVFVSTDGAIRPYVQGAGQFRGALIAASGRVVHFVTPVDGQLAVYEGAQKVLGIGDGWLGSSISEFALNSVSISPSGRLAIRVRLQDGRQVIVRSLGPAQRRFRRGRG